MLRISCFVSLIVAVFVSAALAAEPVVIGADPSMTGNVAAYGGMGWSGISIAKKMRPEVLGRPIEVKLADTKSDKVESANACFEADREGKGSGSDRRDDIRQHDRRSSHSRDKGNSDDFSDSDKSDCYPTQKVDLPCVFH